MTIHALDVLKKHELAAMIAMKDLHHAKRRHNSCRAKATFDRCRRWPFATSCQTKRVGHQPTQKWLRFRSSARPSRFRSFPDRSESSLIPLSEFSSIYSELRPVSLGSFGKHVFLTARGLRRTANGSLSGNIP